MMKKLLSGFGITLIVIIANVYQSSDAYVVSRNSLFPPNRYSWFHQIAADKHLLPVRRPTSNEAIVGILSSSSPNNWEGDDLRRSTRLLRRLRQSIDPSRHPVRNLLILLNSAAFTVQVCSSISWIRKRHPSYWPAHAATIVLDSLWGSAAPGPWTMDWVHSTAWSRQQPHRHLTSGFLHGGVLHLILNMDSLCRLPSWLETGLGPALYLTTFLVSIVAGNLGHSWMNEAPAGHSHLHQTLLCMGSSGGISGLYGLMYICLLRMGNSSAALRVLRGLAFVFLYGVVIANVSNAAHVGGFLGGVFIGILCGPRYTKSYSMRRKWSLDIDSSPRDYRTVMGFGTKPSASGIVPLPLIWLLMGLGLLSQQRIRSSPGLILRGLVQPGSLSSSL